MEDLQADLATGGMHGLGDDPVLGGLFFGAELGRAGVNAAFIVGRDATGDHQADATTGTLGEVCGHAFEAAGAFFEACVHRTHQGAVAQGGEAQVEWSQQVRVTFSSHG